MSKFNYEEEIEKMECPAMFIAGLKFYIKSNKISIKSEKDFEKILKDYKELKLGE